MPLRFGRFNPSQISVHEFLFNLAYLVAATLSVAYLVPIIGENLDLRPDKLDLGVGNVSFTIASPNKPLMSHMYVSAAGGVDNPPGSDNPSNQWSPWIDSSLKVAPGECLVIKATGSVHLSLRRIIAERLNPALLFLNESPNYVGPDGTRDADITFQQRFLKRYSLFESASLGKLIARIRPSDGSNVNLPFQVGKGIAYTVPDNAVSGTLNLAVNDISFRNNDAKGYRNPGDDSNGVTRNMDEAWLGVDATGLSLHKISVKDAQEYLSQNQDIMKSAQQNKEEIMAKGDQDFRQWYEKYFWFNEAMYDIVYKNGLEGWRDTTPKALLKRAREMYEDRKSLKDLVMNRKFDVWYKDNLGGYWVTVEIWPKGKTCKLRN